jgi:DNA topoisomerase II
LYTKPAKKQKAVSKTQTTVKDYFSKGKSNASKLTQRMKPASPPKAKTRPNKVIESEDEYEDIDYSDLPKPPESKRTGGRGAGKNYVDILSSSEE